MGTDDPPAPMVGAWLPFAEAARALGMAERTLRRHVAAGGCAVRRQGRRVSVFVEEAARPVAAPEPAAAALARAVEALAAALDAERARGDRLAARVAAAEAAAAAERRRIERRLDARRGQLTLLPGGLAWREPRKPNGAGPNPRGVQHDHPDLL